MFSCSAKNMRCRTDLTIMDSDGICRLSARARLRLPQRLLRRVRDDLPHQGRPGTEGLPRLLRRSVENNMYVATLPFFPLVKRGLRHGNSSSPTQTDHDAAVPRDLCLRRLQCLHQGLHAGAERHAVHRLCPARRIREVCGGVLRLRYVRRLLVPLSGGHLPSAGRHAGAPPERQIHRPATASISTSACRRSRTASLTTLIESLMEKPHRRDARSCTTTARSRSKEDAYHVSGL